MNESCDKEVYNNGSLIFVTHTMSSARVEEWVQAVAKESGQKVDWHYVGGRAQILFLGDQEKVAAALIKLRPMHDSFFKEAFLQLTNVYSDTQNELITNGIWSYNGLSEMSPEKEAFIKRFQD